MVNMKNILLMTPVRKKILISVIIIIIGIMSYTANLDAVIEKTYISRLDTRGGAYLDDALKKSVVTFAIVRGINGLISVVQGTYVAVTPAGLGVNLAIGEILDPLNDIIERFSMIMLISSTSLGIQKVLMEIGIWFGFKVLICLSMIIVLIGIWLPKFQNINLKTLGYKLIVISIVVRFGIPVVAVSSGKIYDLFLKDKYEESTRSLEKIKGEIEESGLAEENIVQNEDAGFLDTLKDKYQNLTASMDIKNRLSALKDSVSNAVEYIINLIIVFVLQTIIIPLLVLWALVKLTGFLFRSNIPIFIEEKLKDPLQKNS
ncbi:hypothetical protein ACFL1N_01190 [Thermodesulfobacteriota bacterium]